MRKQEYYCMRFYVTYRCNSRCHYCNVWQDARFRDVRELAPEEAKELIRQCYGAGVRYIDFTGGEPTLNPNLAELVRFAKSMGIKTEVTTNGILNSPDLLREIAGCVDKWNVSLDTLHPETYRDIRGVDCFDSVAETMRETIKVRPPKIMMVVSRDNEAELDALISYAQQNRTEIYLNPVFSYFGAEDAGDTEAFSGRILDRILDRIFEPYTVVMLHFLEFYRDGAPDRRPPCSANVRTLTFAPDGALVLPCYHAVQETIPWTGNLSEMLEDAVFKAYTRPMDRPYCRNCSVIPYFGISFNYHLDSYFLMQSYTEKLNHLKRDFLNGMTGRKTNGEALHLHLQELLRILRSLDVKRVPGETWLYRAEHTGDGYLTDIYRKPLTEAEYAMERGADDCWGLTLVPHHDFDRIYESVYRKLHRALTTGEQEKDVENLLRDAEEFQLRWWKWFAGRYMKATVTCDLSVEASWIGGYLQRVLAWGRADGDEEAVWVAEKILGKHGLNACST